MDAARTVFVERPDGPVSTADVAAAAGVTRALVHHYFHGIEELRQALAMEIARSARDVLPAAPGIPTADRVRANVNASLDALEANRDVWFATLGADGEGAAEKPAGRTLRQTILEQILRNNADIIRDTPWARLCLTGYIGFSDAICRRWFLQQASRPEVERALIDTLLHLLLDTIPNHQPPNDPSIAAATPARRPRAARRN